MQVLVFRNLFIFNAEMAAGEERRKPVSFRNQSRKVKFTTSDLFEIDRPGDFYRPN